MKPILTRLFAGLFLLLASQAFGQMSTNFVVTQPAGAPDYPIGTHIIIELRVTNFTNIESMQFPIGYNKDAMKFDSLTNAVFSNWSSGNFVSVPATGKVGISWDGYSNGANMPFSFPNGTAIFKLHFTVIGNGLSSVNINPALAPPSIDVVGNGQPVTLNFQSGGTPTLTLGTGNPPPPPLVGFKIVANTIYIPQGERGCMPVTVNDFDNIVSLQFAMHWDKNVLSYECTRAYNLDGWSATDFSVVPSAPATPNIANLLCTWADPGGSGKTRADGVRIVDVCFKAIGAPGANTTVTIDGNGFLPGTGSAEAYNTNSIDVWTQANHANGYSGVNAPINIISTPASPFDVTYNVDTIPTAPNTQGCVKVKVRNFTAVTSSEFALSYNPSQLTYVSTQFGANPLTLQVSNTTHVTNITPGVNAVKFLWSNTNGKTVANDSSIFSVCFTMIAPAGTVCPVNFTTTACPTVTGMGTAKASGGVSMARNNGWLKSVPSGPTLVATPVSCNGGNNGSIALTNPASTTAMSYAWTGPGINGGNIGLEDQTGLIAGTYTVTVTYSGGTTGTASTVVATPTPLAQTNIVNTVSCFGGSNGAINLTPSGGTPGYTFAWSHNNATTEDLTGLPVGIYTVTIKDANNCTMTASATVTGFIAMSTATAPTINPVTCTGLSTGSIAISITGGAGNYTYDWSHNGPQTPDSDPKDLTGMPSGTYTVTVTDGNGCTTVFPTNGQGYTIGAPQPLTSSLVSKTNVKCFGTASGTATINVTGGTGNMTYCWSTGAGPCASQQQNPTSLAAGTYTVIVTDQNGCTATTANVNIAAPPSALTVSGSGTSAICYGQNTGSINLNVAGGWSGYTYLWDNTNPNLPDPPPIEDPTQVPPGLYLVTVTDAGQCTTTQSVTVSGPQNDITAATTYQHVTCFGTNNGGIDLNLTGGNGGPYTVVWSNTTLTGETIGTLAPGSYQPTVTDIMGCTKVLAPEVVTGPLAPINTDNAVITEATAAGGAIDLNAAGGTGSPDFWQYSWAGPNGFTASTQDISGVNVVAGTYTVTVVDANNCSLVFTFNVPNANVVDGTTVFAVSDACAQDGIIILNVPPVAAAQTPLTITWGLNGFLETSSLNPSLVNLGAGVYNITVTAANGNSTVITNVQVGQKDPASINSTTTNPFSGALQNGKIKLTPAPGVVCALQYQWGPAPLNATTSEVSGLGQGTYFVTVTNPCSGCTSVHEFTLEYGPMDGFSSTGNPTCASSPTGFINVTVQGGNPPYTYAWTGPNGFVSADEDIEDLYPGVYSLVANDVDGRVYNQSYTLTATSNLNITNVNETSLYPSGDQVSGSNMCDGVASVVFTPGVGNSTIQWSNGVTTPNNATLCGGPYSVTVTDGAGCTSVWSDELTAPDAITADQEPVGVKCFGDCNGSAKVFVQGGFAPYSVLWSTGQNDPSVFAGGFSQAVNLCGGDYIVTITDKNGVAVEYTVNVPEPAEIVVNFAATTPRNFNACDGELLIDAVGAVEPIVYTWSGSFGHTGDGERADNLCSGEFVEFFITDANGCTAYATDSVPYPEDGCFRVSPVITPGQQDGKNDFVIITCIETTSENTMEIYNRWGQLVFETDSYTNNDTDREHNWNGLTTSGAVLAEGVYYYVLTFKYVDDLGQEHEGTRKGAINLLR